MSNNDDDPGTGKVILALLKLAGLLVRVFQSPMAKLISKLAARR